ncbi:MAG: hypothetical protein P8Z30_02200 [Acidobacteriota bacterium]
MITRTLGPGYEVRTAERYDLEDSLADQGWSDVVLLDLHDAGEDTDAGATLQLMDNTHHRYRRGCRRQPFPHHH